MLSIRWFAALHSGLNINTIYVMHYKNAITSTTIPIKNTKYGYYDLLDNIKKHVWFNFDSEVLRDHFIMLFYKILGGVLMSFLALPFVDCFYSKLVLLLL